MNSAALMLTLMWWLGSIVRPASHWHRCCDVKKSSWGTSRRLCKKGKSEEAGSCRDGLCSILRVTKRSHRWIVPYKAAPEIEMWNPNWNFCRISGWRIQRVNSSRYIEIVYHTHLKIYFLFGVYDVMSGLYVCGTSLFFYMYIFI